MWVQNNDTVKEHSMEGVPLGRRLEKVENCKKKRQLGRRDAQIQTWVFGNPLKCKIVVRKFVLELVPFSETSQQSSEREKEI